MKVFDIILKNEKRETYRLLVVILVILHAAFFLYLLFYAGMWKTGMAGLVVCVLYGVYRFLISNTIYEKLSFDSHVLIFFAIVFMFTYDFMWLGVVDCLLAPLGSFALRSTVFYFRGRSIVKRKFPYKKYTWDQFSNVILKDGILTLDFKNNTLLQAEIENDIDEAAFNTFAKEHLT